MYRSLSKLVLLLMAAAATWSSFFLITYVRQLEPAPAAGRSCIGREKDALLAFKQGISHDRRDYLGSWQQGRQDCCRWAGIHCSNTTGHVIQLDLGGTYLVGQISPSLLSLEHLEYLNLSNTGLTGPNGRIPEFLGSFKNLRHLDLSSMIFDGAPDSMEQDFLFEFGMLSRMYSTDISWLTRLPLLVHLDLRYTNLSLIADWPLVVNMLPSLEHLSLSNCSLSSVSQSLTHLNLTNLQHLDLSFNNFSHPIASAWFWNLTSIKYLDISETYLYGPFPNSLGNMTSLQRLYFGCHPEYVISDVTCNTATMTVDLRNLCDLEELRLYGSLSSGNITEVLEKSPRCPSNRLQHLDLGSNNMVGMMPDGLGLLTSLTSLDLSYNNITGSIPLSIGNLSHLEHLDLSNNSITGSIPPSIDNLSYLKDLNLCNNHLIDPVPPGIASCTRIKCLDLSYNSITGTMPLCPDFSTNKLEGEILASLSDLTYLSYLDLSHNNLTGRIPSGRQLDTLYLENPSIYNGNIGLCGPPLERPCLGENAPEQVNQLRRKEVSEPVLFFYFGLGSGIPVGLWIVFCALLFNKVWRIAYFRLFDKVYDNAYVFAVVTWRRIKGKATSRAAR